MVKEKNSNNNKRKKNKKPKKSIKQKQRNDFLNGVPRLGKQLSKPFFVSSLR
jgi:hypothetical protein